MGIGNPIRSDDGIGAYVCNLLERLHLPHVTLFELQQLDAELIETLFQFDHIVIVDAAIGGEEVRFYPLADDGTSALVTSHHMNAAMLQLLSQKIYSHPLVIHICAVKGYHFEIGDTLSAHAQANAANAAAMIVDWIKTLD